MAYGVSDNQLIMDKCEKRLFNTSNAYEKLILYRDVPNALIITALAKGMEKSMNHFIDFAAVPFSETFLDPNDPAGVWENAAWYRSLSRRAQRCRPVRVPSQPQVRLHFVDLEPALIPHGVRDSLVSVPRQALRLRSPELFVARGALPLNISGPFFDHFVQFTGNAKIKPRCALGPLSKWQTPSWVSLQVALAIDREANLTDGQYSEYDAYYDSLTSTPANGASRGAIDAIYLAALALVPPFYNELVLENDLPEALFMEDVPGDDFEDVYEAHYVKNPWVCWPLGSEERQACEVASQFVTSFISIVRAAEWGKFEERVDARFERGG